MEDVQETMQLRYWKAEADPTEVLSLIRANCGELLMIRGRWVGPGN